MVDKEDASFGGLWESFAAIRESFGDSIYQDHAEKVVTVCMDYMKQSVVHINPVQGEVVRTSKDAAELYPLLITSHKADELATKALPDVLPNTAEGMALFFKELPHNATMALLE